MMGERACVKAPLAPPTSSLVPAVMNEFRRVENGAAGYCSQINREEQVKLLNFQLYLFYHCDFILGISVSLHPK